MQKIDYNLLMKNDIFSIPKGKKPTLLLHCCCAPCTTIVAKRLIEHFSVTLFYYNPNIYPYDEHKKRYHELERFAKRHNYELLPLDQYKPEDYFAACSSRKDDKEGGERCYLCYRLRLEQTAKKAEELNCEYFCTTLTVSPHKNSVWVNDIGAELQKIYKTKFLPSDFKKENGYLESIAICRDENIYRQNYCGCEYSLTPPQP